MHNAVHTVHTVHVHTSTWLSSTAADCRTPCPAEPGLVTDHGVVVPTRNVGDGGPLQRIDHLGRGLRRVGKLDRAWWHGATWESC